MTILYFNAWKTEDSFLLDHVEFLTSLSKHTFWKSQLVCFVEKDHY